MSLRGGSVTEAETTWRKRKVPEYGKFSPESSSEFSPPVSQTQGTWPNPATRANRATRPLISGQLQNSGTAPKILDIAKRRAARVKKWTQWTPATSVAQVQRLRRAPCVAPLWSVHPISRTPPSPQVQPHDHAPKKPPPRSPDQTRPGLGTHPTRISRAVKPPSEGTCGAARIHRARRARNCRHRNERRSAARVICRPDLFGSGRSPGEAGRAWLASPHCSRQQRERDLGKWCAVEVSNL